MFFFVFNIYLYIYLFVWLSIYPSILQSCPILSYPIISYPILSYPILSIYLSTYLFVHFWKDILYTFDNVCKYTDLVQAQDHRQSSVLVAQPNCMSCHCMDGWLDLIDIN